jgi:uncharacterized protein (TIGR02569 family)
LSDYRATVSSDQPPLTVLRAFGVHAAPRLLTGGQGTSWIAGNVVLKPDSGPVEEWLAEALIDVVADGIRLAEPVATGEGEWICAGWSATRWVEGGEPDLTVASTWIEILEAGRAFHQAIAHLAGPRCLDARQDWWALADRAAWGERTIRFHPELADVSRRLQDSVAPLGPSQIVHADLTGNVLFGPCLAPAIIDISPYWRPPEYAEGVVVADALCWHEAHSSLLELAGLSVAAVARALLFRMATTNEQVTSRARGVDLPGEARRYRLAAEAIGL